MKRFKKLLLLALACLTVFSMGVVSACGDKDGDNTDNTDNTQQGDNTNGDNGGNGGTNNDNDDNDDNNDDNTGDDETTEPEAPIEFVYKIRVQSEGGYGLKDVNVALYDGETKLTSVNTDRKGDAYFTKETVAQVGEYRIELSELPAGWSVADENIVYQTSTVSGSTTNINLSASLITSEAVPNDKVYRLGDVMYDCEIKSTTGMKYKLSDVLKSKKMVLINFWASWCGPCQSEFPFMKEAYSMYSSSVEIFAVSTDSGDTAQKINNGGYNFNFPAVGHPDSGTLTSHFNTSGGIPMSVVIDRYGVVSYIIRVRLFP